MKKSENGFGIVEVLAAVVMVGLIGTTGWLVWDRQKSKQNSQQPAAAQESKVSDGSKKDELPEGFAKYAIGDTGVTLAYPTGWGEPKPIPETQGGGYEVNGLNLKVSKDTEAQIARSFNAPSYCKYSAGNWTKAGEYPPDSCEPSILNRSGVRASGFNMTAYGAYGYTYGINLKGDAFLKIADYLVADATPAQEPDVYPADADKEKLKSDLDKNVGVIMANNKALFE